MTTTQTARRYSTAELNQISTADLSVRRMALDVGPMFTTDPQHRVNARIAAQLDAEQVWRNSSRFVLIRGRRWPLRG